MSVTIPDSLKADMPQNLWGKLLTATPVVMTVVATMLAGLSSSEMTRAQYDRSLAAQQQSKAGDQWSYFQAKRLRGTAMRTGSDLLQAAAEVELFHPAALAPAAAGMAQDLRHCDELGRRLVEGLAAPATVGKGWAVPLAGQLDVYLKAAAARQAAAEKLSAELSALLAAETTAAAMDSFCSGELPAVAADVATEGTALSEALDGVEGSRSAQEMAPVLSRLPAAEVVAALGEARVRIRAFDERIRPVTGLSDQLDGILARALSLTQEARLSARLAGGLPAEVDPALRRTAEEFAAACLASSAQAAPLYRAFTVARLRYSARRYDAEARLNQVVASLYEIQVRQNNLSAERHYVRSQRFFYGMLAAQAAVIVSTFAIAARRRNLLWGLAAAAGTAAVLFAVYVYVYV